MIVSQDMIAMIVSQDMIAMIVSWDKKLFLQLSQVIIKSFEFRPNYTKLQGVPRKMTVGK